MEDHGQEATISKEKAAGMTRRDFMKIGAAVAAGGALPFAADRNGLALSKVSPPTPVDRTVSSSCMLCQARCSMEVQIRDGRVVNVYGRPENEWTGGSICPKGQSMVELTYSPHRLLYPLLRQGDSWKRISYSRAIEIAAEKILKVKKDFPEDYTHRVALFAPLWESREGELAANMTMRLAGFPDFSYSGDTGISNTGATLDACLGTGFRSIPRRRLPGMSGGGQRCANLDGLLFDPRHPRDCRSDGHRTGPQNTKAYRRTPPVERSSQLHCLRGKRELPPAGPCLCLRDYGDQIQPSG
ncbi:MAG: twin-arginine translocation signal domain-containing protein [Deltaproteobacteria bacterium]|nr:twin-arginine translocation signal domain-containing protein [Deltaproteobacteria bacterium]